MITPEQGSVLTGESVKLLVKGDVLRWKGTAISLVHFHYANLMGIQVVDPRDARRWTASSDALTFVGRPDPDGWIVWLGGENPVPGQRVDVQTRNGKHGNGQLSEDWGLSWIDDDRPTDIIAFRLSSKKSEDQGSSTSSIPVAAEGESAGQRQTPVWVRPMMEALHGYEADYGGPLDDMHELGRIDESRESPSFRIRAGHIRDIAAALSHPVAAEGQVSGLSVEERRRIEAAHYMVGNPSAWDDYDEGASETIRDLCALIERLDRRPSK